jgi:excisionase family DNA binding protein
MHEDDELTVAEIARERGLNVSTPRRWVTSGRLAAHADEADPRRRLVYRRDLDEFLDSAEQRSDVGRPRGRSVIEPTTREDWSDAPVQATFDLVSSAELPGGKR